MVLNFFGDTIGEAIVIEVNGFVGMIDSFRAGGRVAALEYVQAKGYKELAFLGLTHPHKDHFGGMLDIIRYFQSRAGIRQFWRYPGLEASHLFPYLEYQARLKIDPFQAQEQASLHELREAILLLTEAIRRGNTTLSFGQQGMCLHRSTDLEICALTPPALLIDESYQAIASAIVQRDRNIPLARWDLNRLSYALDCRYQGLRIVLGGDTTASSWSAAMESDAYPPPSKVDCFKASHHGSEEDNNNKMLARLTGNEVGALAVITRYGPSNLPRNTGIETLSPFWNKCHILSDRLPGERMSAALLRAESPVVQRLQVTCQQDAFIVEGPIAA